MVSDEFAQIQFAAGVIDIDSDQVAFAIVIQNHAFRDIPALDARSVREINIKGICVWEIIQFHGRNLRSRNALCIVSLSESVTTPQEAAPQFIDGGFYVPRCFNSLRTQFGLRRRSSTANTCVLSPCSR